MNTKATKESDPNYLAVVIKCPKIEDHPNANRLSLIEVFGNTIIIGKDQYKEGELLIYFPVECCIKGEFLSWANLFENSDLNQDSNVKGFFQKSRRVRAVSLRSIPSQGFVLPAEKVAAYYKSDSSIFMFGDSFDMVGDDQLVTKYIRPDKNTPQQTFKKSKIPAWINDTLGYLPRPIRRVVYPAVKWIYIKDSDEGIKSKIVEGQWHFHSKTEQLGKNLFVLNPEDNITITSKAHGTSAVFGNIICKKDFTLFQRILKLFGKKYDETEYRVVYSSRSVLKNKRDGTYTDDVWGKHVQELDGKIEQGITLYGEIVGYSSPNKEIQKNYDYGVPKGESQLWIYRITRTDKDGNVKEFNWNEIDLYCTEYDLKTVPVYWDGFDGDAKDVFPDIPIDDNWRSNFLKALKEKYLDKTCEFCRNKVVNEGVVVKINSKESRPAFKFKSPLFNIYEGQLRDQDSEDMEELN
jgi:hypothetical protein